MPGPGGSVKVTTAGTQVVLGLPTTGCFTATGAFVGPCGQACDGVITLNVGQPLNYTTPRPTVSSARSLRWSTKPTKFRATAGRDRS